MKKAAIISITAFYLLFTTGIYICLLHCASEFLLSKPVMQMSESNSCKRPSKMDCKGDKDHSCCKMQSNDVIKENTEIGSESHFSDILATINPLLPYHFAARPSLIINVCWADYNAPPWQSGKSRTIRFRSIQI